MVMFPHLNKIWRNKYSLLDPNKPVRKVGEWSRLVRWQTLCREMLSFSYTCIIIIRFIWCTSMSHFALEVGEKRNFFFNKNLSSHLYRQHKELYNTFYTQVAEFWVTQRSFCMKSIDHSLSSIHLNWAENVNSVWLRTQPLLQFPILLVHCNVLLRLLHRQTGRCYME